MTSDTESRDDEQILGTSVISAVDQSALSKTQGDLELGTDLTASS